MDTSYAQAILDICGRSAQGATVEDCAEELCVKNDELAALFTTFDELVRRGCLMRIAGEHFFSCQEACRSYGYL